MEQSVTRVSAVGKVARVLLVALLSLVGLSVVGVSQASAATGVTVKSLTPATNNANGGNSVIIAGSGFGTVAGSVSVTFGGVPATSFVLNSGIKITATVPPAPAHSPAAVEVIVTVSGVASTPAAPGDDTYTYEWLTPPTVTGVGLTQVTATSQVGTVLTVTAAGTWTAGQLVNLSAFRNNLPAAVYTVITGGTGSFTVTNWGSTTGTGTGLVSPSSAGAVGSAAGGTPVIIFGSNFGGASAVDFGSTPSTSFVVNSSTEITANAPPGTVGPVDVTVTTPPSGGTTAANPAVDTFTYVSTPTVTGVTTTASPAGGPDSGGTQVTLSGTSFDNVTAVDFGGTAASSFLVNSLTSLTAVAPAGTGTVDITVTADGLTSATGSSDRFAYNGTLAVANGNASYANAAGVAVPVTATSQTGSTVTVTAAGAWTAGQQVGLSGFTNGLTAGTYTVLTGATGSFTFTFAPSLTGSGTGSALVFTTVTASAVTATSQAGTTVTISSVGTWFAGQRVYLTGFTNGLTTGNYAVTGGTTGSFTITFAPTLTGTSTGTAIPYQMQSFNAATLITGGGTVTPGVTVTAQPSSGSVAVQGNQLLYTPAQGNPTPVTEGSSTIWDTNVTTTGTQTATIQVCQSAPTSTCATATMTYTPAANGFYVGNQLDADGIVVSVVEDTGSGVVAPSTASTGSTFTTVTAPTEANLPSTNSGFTVEGIGGYRSITPVPTGISLVPGSLAVTGGDTATTGKFTATLCTQAMGFVPNTCTANFTGNFKATYPYIETSLNVGTQIPGGSQLSLPTVTAQWTVTASSGTVSTAETEFVVVTNVQTIGSLNLDAYPTDLASYLNQGESAPVPTYAAPSPRWTVTISGGGSTPPSITSANTTTFTAGTAGTFNVTASGNPASSFTETGTLPSGVTLTTAGVLAGTPAAGSGGTYPITITANNGVSPNATQNFTLTVDEAPAITSAAATTFKVGTAGTFTATATGFPSATFTETGTLPTGVTLTSAGVLSGTPAASQGGSYPITITAANGVTPDATQSFTLTVNQAPAVTSAASATFKVGTAGTFSVTTTGYPTASITESGTLPTGVTLTTAGILSGTPAAGQGGSYPITVTAANGVTPDATQSFTLTVDEAPAITSANSTGFTVGVAGNFAVTASGYPTSSFTETGALPAGVTLTSAGVLSGTPILGSSGSYPITFTANNGINPNATQSFTLSVTTVPVAPSITSVASTTFTVGTAGTFAVTASGNPAPTFSETGALPTGVTLTSGGALSGTPAAGQGGTYPITITATNGISPDATQSFTLTVDQAPVITSAASTTFTVGTAGTFTVTATGNPAPTFSETGALPTGVTLTSGGVLAGTPASGTGGAYPITITASNGATPAGTQSFTLTVTAPPTAPTITSADATTFTVGTAGTFQVTATGYPVPTYSETGALPTGVTFTSGGVLAGTPAAGQSGTYALVITAANTVSPNATQDFTLTVHQAPAITSATSTNFVEGTAGTFTVTATGSPVPTFTETGALPAGVTLTTAGVLAGTPTQSGSFPITITASNGVSPNATQSFTLTVTAPPTITSAASTTFTVGTAGTFTVTATGSPAPTFTETGTLPTGVTLTSAGVLSGTPAAGQSGTYPIVITATNGVTPNATQDFTLTVNQAPAITSAASTNFVLGTAGTFTVTATGSPAPTFAETGTLPAGVTLTSGGVLAGTPTQSGSFPVTITASNGVSPNATQGFTLHVLTVPGAPTITDVSPGNASVAVSWTPGSTGGSPILSYQVASEPTSAGCTVTAPATTCTVTGLTNGTPYQFEVRALNAQGPGPGSLPSAFVTPSASGPIQGYWMVTSTGAVLTNGAAVNYGSPAGLKLSAPIVSLVPTPDRKGYWVVGADGGVFNYGDAGFYGSAGNVHLAKPIVGMAVTSDGKGYWLVASDGGVFAYGDAAFVGSMGGKALNAPIVGIAGNGTGGYLLVGADGGIFAFGSATFHGSAGGEHLVAPVVGISALANGSGYYLAAADGGVFAYNAPFLGSAHGVTNTPIVGISAGAAGGYTLAGTSGAVFAYPSANYYGSQVGSGASGSVVSVAS